jgi:hypothetical protein
MAINEKKKKTVLVSGSQLIAVNPSLPEFDNHPFFEKKVKTAKSILAKVGLPKSLISKKKK